MNQDQQAVQLTEEIQKVAPAYSVSWVDGKKIFPDHSNNGFFEIFGSDGKVHYRRQTVDEVRKLIH